MSDVNSNDTPNEELDDEGLPKVDEKQMLMQRARIMGIKFSNNISVDALREKVANHLAGEADKEENQEGEVAPLTGSTQEAVVEEAPKQETLAQMRARLRKEATKLVRVRITCLDPKKANLPGEILTVANEYIGTIRRYVPYGEKTDEGWHVEHALYEFLKSRKFLQIKQVKGQNGRPDSQKWESVREFALEVLPTLTEGELAKLRATQAAAGGVED